MFKTLKIYSGQKLSIKELLKTLVDFAYNRQNVVLEEGDFALRGQTLDVFPSNFEFPLRIVFEYDKIEKMTSYNLNSGKALWAHDMAIILPRTIRSVRNFAFKEDMPFASYLDLEIDDCVVHIHHGIGRYKGMKKIKALKSEEPCLIIQYLNNEKVYVPMDKIYLVQKYVSFEHRRPKLNRLGSKQWLRTKENAKNKIRTFALSILELQAKRQYVKGIKFSKDSDWQYKFEGGFPFKETVDQENAACEVKQDMESTKPMDRLLCGDVGYGKTEVAMRAAFKAMMDNKQVAILVPTTILAEQHFHNFKSRINDFPVNIEMLSRFKSKAEQKHIIQGLKEGKIDLVIGTHRLLTDDIKFKDLGLLIIDEEQRFGVAAKDKLKNIRLNVDVLTLTATPIPRTFYMSLVGLKDISLIETPPKKRLSVKTYVNEFDEDLIKHALNREIKRGGQVYFVHNQIYDIDKIKNRISEFVGKNIKVEIAHGQMPAKVLERIIIDFLDNKIKVLVCSNIIESGMDVPNANTLVVNNADRFGLSDLHQLRGRVGRFESQAYAYFLIKKNMSITADANKRLSALVQYSKLGSGFKIAMQDLEIRGAGNILGKEQHGFISTVGFDLYCRLLRETVSLLSKNGKN
ncbi:MAG: transcription-repair coupling factor [Candidatus Gygaella obscura]|nr:transcription-repair coupling factor [Candidatus Gygaella obscura]